MITIIQVTKVSKILSTLRYFAGTLLEIERILEAKDKEIDNGVKIKHLQNSNFRNIIYFVSEGI
jgi:hypothetical protein